MAKRIRRPRSGAKTETYLKAAKELATYVPKLKKFRRRKTLSGSEKSQIARYISKIGRTTQNLTPLTKKEQKLIPKSEWVSPSIPALKVNQLRKEDIDVRPQRRGVVKISEKIAGGKKREWIFWPLSMASHIPKSEPFKRVEYLVNMAFDIYDVKQMHLWNTQGIAGFGYGSPDKFFTHYYDSLQPGKIGSGGSVIQRQAADWLLGIAFQIEE